MSLNKSDYFKRPANTDLSTVKMVERQCECYRVFKVAETSTQTKCSIFCGTNGEAVKIPLRGDLGKKPPTPIDGSQS